MTDHKNQIDYLCSKHSVFKNSKGLKMTFGVGIINNQYVDIHMKRKFGWIFYGYEKVGYIVGPEKLHPWYRFFPGMEKLHPDSDALFKMALKFADEALAENEKIRKAKHEEKVKYGEVIMSEYLKRGN